MKGLCISGETDLQTHTHTHTHRHIHKQTCIFKYMCVGLRTCIEKARERNAHVFTLMIEHHF